jgi:hypothetical protein
MDGIPVVKAGLKPAEHFWITVPYAIVTDV